MSADKISEKLRALHNLPENWNIHSWECLPKDEYNSTHIQVTGAESRPRTCGPRKGQLTWPNNGKNGKRTFLFTNEEYDELIKS
jgi:hypothetical protein